MSTEARPFLKWAGGKGQLLSQLDGHLPNELQRQSFTYIEPFVGGGAMLFYMLRKFPNITHAVINDINPHLVTAFRVIKEKPDELIQRLSAIEKEYFSHSDEESKKDYYLNVRNIFNEKSLDDIDRTKYLIFLNRTCFNGLYRVNAKGKFNVPFGRNLHPTICNADTILADSEVLNRANVTILNGDFERTADEMYDGLNFFYFDPPYRPLNATSSFNSYAKEDFNDDEQIRLRNFCAQLNRYPNVKWMLSNADCSAKNPEDTFFEEIYADYHIHRVFASRAINANPERRGKLTELLIKNYE
jgi:DNA adenine methylase